MDASRVSEPVNEFDLPVLSVYPRHFSQLLQLVSGESKGYSFAER